MKKEYKDIFNSLGKEEKESLDELSLNSRVLLIDGLNTFLRSFSVIRHVNKGLTPIGGLTGFLRSLGHVINLVRPTRVIIVFDGKGSSTNKKYIYPEYKANRNLKRITNWDHYDNQEEESDSIRNQMIRLIEYLKCLPVDLLIIDKVEADDIIGYLANRLGDSVTIVSTDRDYMQLVNNRITLYSPTKKKFYDPKAVLQEYGVTPKNFLTQKILLGDSGDNVPGVLGLGPKTLLKEFSELGSDNLVTIDDIIKKCESGVKKVHKNIIQFKAQLDINKQLMDLHDPNIPEQDISEIHQCIDNPYKEFNSAKFMSMYEEDDLQNSILNLQNWLFTNFHVLQKYNK